MPASKDQYNKGLRLQRTVEDRYEMPPSLIEEPANTLFVALILINLQA